MFCSKRINKCGRKIYTCQVDDKPTYSINDDLTEIHCPAKGQTIFITDRNMFQNFSKSLRGNVIPSKVLE